MKVTNPTSTPAFIQIFKNCEGYPKCEPDDCKCGSGQVGNTIEVPPKKTIEVFTGTNQ